MKLFGSALEVKLPKEGAGWHWIDCSSVCPVPDHQEVFMLSDRNVSIIVEILELSPMTIQDYFTELAECNEASQVGSFSTDISTNNGTEKEKDSEEKRNEESNVGYGWQLVKGQRIFVAVGMKREGDSEILVSINSINEDDMSYIKGLLDSLVVKDPSIFNN